MDANLTADQILTKPGVGLRSLIPLAQAARPRQWIKNLACFAGLVFSGRMFDPAAIVESILAFAGFCLAASAVYLLNDVVDRRVDLLNPSKRNRPIASGLVPVSWRWGRRVCWRSEPSPRQSNWHRSASWCCLSTWQ